MTEFHIDHEPKVKGKPRESLVDDRLLLDGLPSVTRDEALELMVHHLQLAEIYYQATPKDEIAVLKELERLMASNIPTYVAPALVGARSWLAALNLFYSNC